MNSDDREGEAIARRYGFREGILAVHSFEGWESAPAARRPGGRIPSSPAARRASRRRSRDAAVGREATLGSDCTTIHEEINEPRPGRNVRTGRRTAAHPLWGRQGRTRRRSLSWDERPVATRFPRVGPCTLRTVQPQPLATRPLPTASTRLPGNIPTDAPDRVALDWPSVSCPGL